MKKAAPFIIGFLVLVLVGIVIFGLIYKPIKDKKREEAGGGGEAGTGGNAGGGFDPIGNSPVNIPDDEINDLADQFYNVFEASVNIGDRCPLATEINALSDTDLIKFWYYYKNEYHTSPYTILYGHSFVCVWSYEDTYLLTKFEYLENNA